MSVPLSVIVLHSRLYNRR